MVRVTVAFGFLQVLRHLGAVTWRLAIFFEIAFTVLVQLLAIVALVIFTAASLGAGLAWSLESLIAFRFLQGVGGGMLTPVGMAMVFRAFPRDRRAIASAIVGTG